MTDPIAGAGKGEDTPARHATQAVRTLSPYQPGKPIAELERELGIADIVKLASNENPLGASPRALAAMRAALDDVWLYPDGSGHELKAALAGRLGVEPRQITLGDGSNELLMLLAEGWLTPQASAVYSQYGFAIYKLVVHATGAEGREAPALAEGSATPFGHDLDAMARFVDGTTRLVFIASPNNPTGTWVEEARLRRFIEETPRSTLVVLDEAYFEYSRGFAQDGVPWIAEYPHLLVLRTFSKIHGLAGMRVGYAVSHPEVAEILNRVRQAFNVGSVAMAGAIAALEDDGHVRRGVELVRAGREQLARGLRQLGLGVQPSAGNFLLVKVGPQAQQCFEKLLQRGIIVRPLRPYGLGHHLRITIGTPAQNERLLRALPDCLGA